MYWIAQRSLRILERYLVPYDEQTLHPMVKWIFRVNPLVILLSAFLLSSCEEFVGELFGVAIDEAVDCVFPLKAELKGRLEDGKVGQPYTGQITGYVKNTPADDWFDFVFEVSGNPPEGIEYNVFEQNVRFSGMPAEAGVFRFTIELQIYDTRDNGGDAFCLGNNDFIAQDYVLTIAP